MAIDWLTDPISDDQPCGADLVATDDDAFIGYYFEAEAALPERYFVPGIRASGDNFARGTVFDSKSIRHAAEKETILGLLRKSRDVRLLSLLARQQVLSGRLEGFVEAVDAVALLLETYPTDVHPQDTADRRGALEELGATTTVVTPLQYINLAGAGEVTLRKYMAATGQSEPREGEVGLSGPSMLGELGSPSNKGAVDQSWKLIGAALDAVQRIKGSCLRGDRPFTIGLVATGEVLTEMRNLIAQARPDLQGEVTAATPVAATETMSPQSGEVVTTTTAPTATLPSLAPQVIPSQAAAKQALRAIEMFFARYEPSSAALLLVTQARLLVGKPLIEAIETLLPEDSSKARIDFGPNTGFSMSMDRLRLLSKELSALVPAEQEADPGPPPVVTTRAEVAAWLRDVEDYFRKREPASPIPLLLSRAKSYLDKDFSSLISELLPAKVNI